MSIKIMTRVWEDSKQTEGALLVMLAMADCADHDGVCFPSQQHIADKARLSERQVRRVINKLISEEELKVIRPSAGRGKRTIYKIFPKPGHDVPLSDIKADIGDTKRRTLATPSIIKEPSLEPPSLHATFISLWTASYSEHFGCEYAFQSGKDAKSVQHLLASSKLSPGELITIAQAAWKNAAGFYCKSAASITGFNSKFNEIRLELKNGTHKKSSSERGRGAGTANEGKSKQYAGIGRIQ